MWEYRHTDELYHYGRKGMKWGQHIFGKVKKAIQNHRKEREAAKAEKARAAEELKKRNKSVHEMTDDELRQRKARLQLEKEYLSVKNEVDKLLPQKVNKGKELVNKFMKEAVTPTLVDAGKKFLQNAFDKAMKEKVGVNTKELSNTLELLRKPIEELTDAELGKLATRGENTQKVKTKFSEELERLREAAKPKSDESGSKDTEGSSGETKKKKKNSKPTTASGTKSVPIDPTGLHKSTYDEDDWLGGY